MYNKENDNELIYLVSESNEDAKELLNRINIPLLVPSANKSGEKPAFIINRDVLGNAASPLRGSNGNLSSTF